MQEIRLLKQLCVVLALLIALYAGLAMYNPENAEETAAEQVVAVTDTHVFDIKALALKNSSGSFGLLVGENGSISMEPNSAGVNYSLQEMQGFIYLISKISSLRVIDKYDSIESFGFNNPQAVVTIITGSGEKLRFLLGMESGADGGHYFIRQNGEKIYVVSAETVKLLMRSKKDFVERSLLPSLGIEGIDRLGRLSIFSRTRAGRKYTVENLGGYRFELSAPIRNVLSTERVFSEIILPLTSLYPDGAADIEPERIESANADYELEMVIDGMNYKLYFIKKDADTYYVKSSAKGSVFEIPAERVAFMDMDYLELLSGAIYSCNVSRIESIIFDNLQSRSNHTLYVSGIGEDARGEIEGRIIPYRELMTFINILNSLAMSEEVQGESELGEPYYTITLNKPDGGRDYIEFISAGGNQSYFRVNGVVNFMIFDNVVSKFIDAVNTLCDSEVE